MINRRNLLVAAAAIICTAGKAGAADWKSQYPELTFAVVPAENASGVSDRFTPFVDYLSKELGVPVKLRVANDYAAVIEGQRAGNIQIAYYGPASYSTAYLTGVKTEPFVTTRNNDGAIGYYSVIYVKADTPYKDIHDLKGKTIGFVDPNSTSGYNAPRFYLHKAGHRRRQLLRQIHHYGQPRERGHRAGQGDGRLRRQLVERRQRFEPDTNGQEGHGEKGGFSDHFQIRITARLALRVPFGPSRQSQARHPESLHGGTGQGQGGLRPPVGWQGQRIRRGYAQGLPRHRRDDSVRRRDAQETELTRQTNSRAGGRPVSPVHTLRGDRR
jgi:ABC transporter, phosphonate, periplasmic substrate-binding protein